MTCVIKLYIKKKMFNIYMVVPKNDYKLIIVIAAQKYEMFHFRLCAVG